MFKMTIMRLTDLSSVSTLSDFLLKSSCLLCKAGSLTTGVCQLLVVVGIIIGMMRNMRVVMMMVTSLVVMMMMMMTMTTLVVASSFTRHSASADSTLS